MICGAIAGGAFKSTLGILPVLKNNCFLGQRAIVLLILLPN